MKRDMDLVRDLLIQISDDSFDDEKSDQNVLYHLELLSEKGFITGIKFLRDWDGTINYGLSSLRLTWDGNELLETIRPKGIWEKIKKALQERGVGLTIDAIAKVAPAVVSAALTSSN